MLGGASSYGFHRIAQFIRCPQLFAYKWVLNLVPQNEGQATGRGTLVHEGLAGWYQHGLVDSAWQMMQALGPRYSTWLDEAQRVVLAYIKLYRDERFDVLAVEHEIAVDIGEYPFTRKLDLVARHHDDGRIWVYDHKTAWSISERLRNARSDWSLATQTIAGKVVLPGAFGGEWGGFVLNLIDTKELRFDRQPILFAERELAEIPRSLHWYLKEIDALKDRNPFDYPRSGACLDRYGMCPYRALCEGGMAMRRLYDEE